MVVLVPESGDSVQAMKAGLMEIADFFVMNKSDRPGADTALTSLQTILMFREHDENSYMPKILKCIASENIGVQEILLEINRHREYLIKTEEFIKRRKNINATRIRTIVEQNLWMDIWNKDRNNILENKLDFVVKNKLSPYTLAEEIIKNYKIDISKK